MPLVLIQGKSVGLRGPMLDILFVAIGLAFLGAAMLYAVFCEHL
jgi:hypothetical protein